MDQSASNGLDGSAYGGRRVLVTGGAGFIGSNLVGALVDAGAAVRVYDDGSTGDLQRLSKHGGAVELHQASVLDAAGLQQAVAGIETVFHLAAVCSVPGSVQDPGKYHLINTTGTALLLEACRQAGVGRVVFSSSSAVYGDEPGQPKHEAMAVAPLSPYAASKAASEALLRAYAGSYAGLDAVSLRYFNVYGPGQNANSAYAAVIAAFAQAYARGIAPIIYGDGGQTRDFVAVDDVVQANLRAGLVAGPLNGRVLNIGSGASVSVKALASVMAGVFGRAVAEPVHKPARAGEVRDSLASIDQAQAVLGYAPAVGLEEGLRRTLASFTTATGDSPR